VKPRRSNEADGHDNTSEIVQLASVKFFSEASAIKQQLEAIGIRATIIESDNLVPFTSFQGNRIMVFARDFDKAKQVVADVEAQDVSESDGPSPTVTKHLRHHGDT
jgi:hypothetical protein